MKNAECKTQSSDDAGSSKAARRDIGPRTLAFAVRIVTVANALPRNVGNFVIARQLVRSGTSIGANVEEAEAAHSKPEFILKMNIARKEARETRYWLRLLIEADLMSAAKLRLVVGEAEELVGILTAIVRNARARLTR